MTSSNYRRNKAAIEQFQKELKSMLGEVDEVNKRIMNRAVNDGMSYAKNNSPRITGFFAKSWFSTPAVKRKDGSVTKHLVNTAEYAPYVNYGHRIVDKEGKSIGYVRSKQGDHLLEKTVDYVNKRLIDEFEKEIRSIQKKHDK